jgi:hypothetical protein
MGDTVPFRIARPAGRRCTYRAIAAPTQSGARRDRMDVVERIMMQNQHSTCANQPGVGSTAAAECHRKPTTRISARSTIWRCFLAALLAVAAVLPACTSQEPASANASADVKDAGGVDAEFGVQSFALTEPTITGSAPVNEKSFAVASAGGKVDVDIVYSTANFTPGSVRCYFDGNFVGLGNTTTYKFLAVGKGLHTISCVLADNSGTELTGTGARVSLNIKVAEPCKADSDCSDGNACSQDVCVGGQCVYGVLLNCCGSKFNCAVGELCVAPNTANSKCSTCSKDTDCNDNESCTTDKCDLSGSKGLCSNVKANKECCSKASDPCDDGKGCTTDSCNTSTGTCTHEKAANACCSDTDCVQTDPCLVGQCVDNQCRTGPNNFRPDCCSAGNNPSCNDKATCTLDKCDKNMGGWMQCTHIKDPSNPKCCEKDSTNQQCDDGQPCTWDVCLNWQCENQKLATCCVTTIDCDDGNPCTNEICTLKPGEKAGNCSYPKTPGCCVTTTDCDDNKYCTIDTCNYAALTCKYIKPDPSCCDADSDCDDGKLCTVKLCINHQCVFGKDNTKTNCCDANVDCNDGLACTVDTCDTAQHQCQSNGNGNPDCCNDSTACNDGDCTTFDYCDSFSTCKYSPKANSCKADIDCDDGIICTTDKCDTVNGCGQCSHTQLPQETCCVGDLYCDDKDPCTADTCSTTTNKCEHAALANCCKDDATAQTTCDDKNACTIEYCLNNSCRHTVPKNGCCATDGDCGDNNACTTDKCANLVGGKGSCQNTSSGGNCSECALNSAISYDDGNPCTADTCQLINGIWKQVHTPMAGCCLDKFDCNDSLPCTYDFCVFNECMHTSSDGGQTLCCSPETEATDCAYLNAACATGKCLPQTDGKLTCQAVEKTPCTVGLSYCQDFEGAGTLSQMGWIPGNVKGTAATNWGITTATGLGPDQAASLLWTPTKSQFLTCLQSPIIQAAGASAVTVQFDREFVPALANTTLTIRGSLGGATPDWNTAIMIDAPLTTADQLGPETLTIKLPTELAGSNGLRIAFCVDSTSSLNFDHFAVDNVCIVKGSAPTATKCPANQAVMLGSTLNVPIKVQDADPTDTISFSLVQAPAFVKLSGALYYWLDNTWNSTLTINPLGVEDIGEHDVTIKYTDGYLYGTCTFKISVTYIGGYLIWQPSEALPDSALAFKAAINATNQYAQIAHDLSLYQDLSKFKALFITLGVYPDNHVLSEAEIAPVKAYLSGGGKVYIEGGDTFMFDLPTTLHPFFKIKGVLDSAGNGVTGPLKGYSAFSDISTSPATTFSWAYSQDPIYDNLNDEIEGNTTVAKTRNLLRNEGNEKFWVAVGHDDPSAKYRTVGTSVPFAGVLTSGAATQQKMFERIKYFFENGFIDCTKDGDCDDGNPCTKDTCAAGACANDNTCMCGAQTALTCGGTLTKQVTNGGASTQVTSTYSCDGTNTYLGKEIAFSYTAVENAPLTVTLTNVSNPNARIFVLKDSGKGCDPTTCVATTTGTKVTTATFAGSTYFIVVDVPGASEAAQFDLSIACGTAENCSNGTDDNNNGLVDCADKDSCCGDIACAVEVCNNIDDNCDGNIDEGCDDDGDGYCDAAMTVVGTPAICPAGKNDCLDTDGTVNPGATETCNNAKDDNCSGAQNEENANGCVKYFSDLDGDAYGAGTSKCLCAPSGSYKATQAGDCNDAKAAVNPAATESCNTADDDNCDGSTNDANATGCTNFYTDVDGDLWGTSPFKCTCIGAGQITANQPGDCADTNASINPAITEICDNIDNNCNGQTDEGCDDDKDGYCDTGMTYVPPTSGNLPVCPKGPGDTVDTNPDINPAGAEICDGLDNNSNGQTDEGCDDDKDGYCDVAMYTSGKPPICPLGGGDCNDIVAAVNPGVKEDCGTPVDDNCDGNINDLGAIDCTPFFFDGDGDKWGTPANKCSCTPIGQYNAQNPGDCNDDNKLINPGVTEICDGIDNDCDGVVDNTCDDDGDLYCDSNVPIVGTPAICPNGSGDCLDTDAQINPGKAEICGDGKDNNCNGSQNDANAIGCAAYYTDADGDSYGAGTPKCQCSPGNSFTATNNADCKDGNAAINPAALEICNSLDDNCDGKTDEGCDDDLDGQCDATMQIVGTPAICPLGGGDCNDTSAKAFKGKTQEVCDGVDDDCNGTVDNGCDDDQDGYCDAGYTIANPTPGVCSKGTGDCDDYDASVNPGANEVCGNLKDDNCNGSQNDAGAVGCSTFYYDGDVDTYGSAISKCLCIAAGSYTATKGGDCDDFTNQVSPSIGEKCNGIDDNCDGNIDEPGALACTNYFYDEDKDGYGLNLTQCQCAPGGFYTASSKGDCDDTNPNMTPGKAEKCDNIDNNCNTQVDEGCNMDGDQFCTKNMTTVGAPAVCPLGGNDCDDTDKTVSPTGNETCNGKDDNCSGATDEGCDDDGDKYCDANMTTVGTPAICTKGGGDCNDGVSNINPGAPEVCGNTVDENCSGGYNDINAVGCSIFYVDFDGDTYGKGGTAFQKVILNEVRRNTNGMTGATGNEYMEFLISADVTTAEFDSYYFGDSSAAGDAKFGVFQTKIASLGISTLKAGTIVVVGGGALTSDKTYNTAGGDWTLTLLTTDTAVITTTVAGADFAASDVAWIDSSSTGTTSLDSIRYGAATGALGLAAKVQLASAPTNGLTGVIAFTGDITGIDLIANYQLDATSTPGAGNGGSNTTLVNSLRTVSTGGDSRCQCIADATYKTTKAGDCNDSNENIYTGAVETCDGVDNNCNGTIDEGCDADGDGYCSSSKVTVGTPPACPNGGGDCNDTNKNINPGATDSCTGGGDMNCDGVLSPGAGACTTYYYDGDADGYGANITQCLCAPTGAYTAAAGGDCDDTKALVKPSMTENCSTSYDDNCDGLLSSPGALNCVNYYTDADKDGYGVGTAVCQCVPTGSVIATVAGDCNDADVQVNPGKSEICDGKDNNCNGSGASSAAQTNAATGTSNSLTNYLAQEIVFANAGNFASVDVSIAAGAVGQTVTLYLYKTALPTALATGQAEAIGPVTLTATAMTKYTFTSVAKPALLAGEKWIFVWKASGTGTTIQESSGNAYANGAVFIAPSSPFTWASLGAGATDVTFATFVVTSGPTVDEGCNDDGDTYCDGNMDTVTPPPATCTKGGGDCNDTLATVNKDAVEICDNIDNNCDGKTDEGCDSDGDGYCNVAKTVVGAPAVCTLGKNDCDDTNKNVYPGKAEMCDGVDNNCSGATDEGCDADGDKYCTTAMSVIGTPAICNLGGGDCNDSLAAINPGALEICDNIDNNCAGGTDETCTDGDKDGYCNGTAPVSSGCPKGGGDCDDTNIAVNPGAAENCSTTYDDNCNGLVNEVGAANCANWYADGDNDGYGGGAATCQCAQTLSKPTKVSGDCLDSDATVNPAAVEICDGKDNDCKNGLDEGCDDDVDSYCDVKMVMASTATCTKSVKPAAGSTKSGDDCNDAAATVNPGSTEICDNLDNNCNSVVDDGCDDDNDNYCEAGLTITGTPATCTAGGNDCNDNQSTINPAAQENCSTSYDDNCDGSTDALNAVGCKNFFYDGDGDGYGVTGNFQCRCAASGKYAATVGGDCDDLDPTKNSGGAAETCDGIDNNCNGTTDEGCDVDKDGYCDAAKTVTSNAACPKTTVNTSTYKGNDCDDTNNKVNPGAVEACDAIDNNCVSGIDELCNKDGDAYCDINKPTVGTPPVCTGGGGDCDDTNGAIRPGASELCNGKDDNCNALIDEAGAVGCSNWYFDGDQDGYGIASSQCLCAKGGLYSASNTTDCNDTCPTCYPGAAELCDGNDNNCNNSVDEGCNVDGDGYCTKAMVTVGTPAICSKGGGDCNDGNGSIFPAAFETCNNVDDNCNGVTDENASDQCPTTVNATFKCISGSCQITACASGFSDVNGAWTDGCECNGMDPYEPNDTCGAAVVVDTALYDNGKAATVEGRVVQSTDHDWFSFYAADLGDAGYAACDAYNVRVVFTKNPGGLVFDVWKGSCPAGGTNAFCCGRTDFNWFTNFKSGTAYGGSWSGYGECPCQTGNQFDNSNPGWNLDPGNGGPYCKDYNSGYVCFPTGFSFTQCQDDSSWFYVKVYKATGAANCANYSLEFTNGVYGQPGTGAGATGY